MYWAIRFLLRLKNDPVKLTLTTEAERKIGLVINDIYNNSEDS